MCPGRERRKLLDMDGTTIAVELELQVGGDCLTGSVGQPDGSRRQYTGWLGLIAAITALVDAAELRGTNGTDTTTRRTP